MIMLIKMIMTMMLGTMTAMTPLFGVTSKYATKHSSYKAMRVFNINVTNQLGKQQGKDADTVS